MPLIDSHRLTDEDRAAWPALTRRFRQPAWKIEQRAEHATERVAAFLRSGPAYVSTSWGKDSMCVLHLARMVGPEIPVVWAVLPGADNPDCAAVRDAYLDRWPANYAEVQGPAPEYQGGVLRTGARRGVYAVVEREHGSRRIMGIRAQESGTRALSALVHGASTAQVCRPILNWSTADVFAHLLHFDLPIHPAYAMTMGGRLDVERLRVASIGGERGSGFGRRAWEMTYYGDCAPYFRGASVIATESRTRCAAR